MPTKTQSVEVMKESGGKHWTKKEIEAREKASELVKRKKPKGIYAPASLSKEAKPIWNRVLSSVQGIDLLDNMDTELLEVYCETVAKTRRLSKLPNMDPDQTKAWQANVRLVKSLANELGLSPNARARLVKKAGDKELSEFDELFG